MPKDIIFNKYKPCPWNNPYVKLSNGSTISYVSLNPFMKENVFVRVKKSKGTYVLGQILRQEKDYIREVWYYQVETNDGVEWYGPEDFLQRK